jgi:hypothetical protein
VAQLVEAVRCKVAGSIPEGVIGIFHGLNPSGSTMSLGSTQTETEMSTRPLGPQKYEAPRISRQSAHKGGKVVSPTHRPSLPPRRYF